MKRKLTLFLTLFLMGAGIMMAQTQVRGTVVDESNEPVIGASIRVKSDKSKGTVTDGDGKFTISVATGETLIISYVGLKTQEIAAAANVRVAMETDAELLDDIVVVAYGAVKKQSMVGAQSSVTARQLEKRPITNLTAALGGAAPGVQVLTSSGQPGSRAEVRIRGFGSANASSAPLYVVDGAVYNGNISDIAAQDIQSVNILKDASATALYGSSAGNGVILVTTKSGSRASATGKPEFTFTSNFGVSKRGMVDYEKADAMQHYPLRWQQWYNTYKYDVKMPDEQAAYHANKDVIEDLRYQPYTGVKTYITLDKATGEWKKTDNPVGTHPLIVMPDGTLNPEINGLLWGDDMDWEDALFRSGFRQEYMLSGGLNTERMKSYLSLNYLEEDGYKRYTSLNRFSLRTNLSYDINKWLSVGTNTSIVSGHSESPKAIGNYSANAFGFMSGIAPIYPIHRHNEDGSYVLDGLGNKLYDYNRMRPYTPGYNPVYEQSIDKSITDRDAITSRIFAQINLYKGLTFRANLAYDLLRNTKKWRFNNIMGDQPQGLLEITNRRHSTITANQLLEYDTNIGSHHINALLGHEAYKYKEETSSGMKDKMFIIGLDEMSNLTNMRDISSGTDNYRKEGYFGRINYDFSDLYNLSASYRYDGTSRFSPDNRWGHFWSVGAGWNISNEEFMKNSQDWLNNLKLRASIGQTGNDAISGYYAYQSLFSLGNNNLENIGLRRSSRGNPDLIWEKQTSFDLALEFSLFKRLRGTVEFFRKVSDDLLFAFPLPLSTGSSSINKNLGKISNRGWEFDLRYTIVDTREWRCNVAVNGTAFRNKIDRLPEENRKNGIEKKTKKWMEGKSIYDFYLNEYIGVDPKDGLAIYRLDDVTYPDLADPDNPNFVGMEKEGEKATWTKDGRFIKKHYAGTAIPDLYGGFSSQVSYKNFDFDIQFAYQLGGKVYDSGYQGLMGRSFNDGSAMHTDMLNAWKKPGDITNVPRLDAASTNYDNKTSDRYLISGTSLMLKSVSLGYTLPAEWIKPLDLTNARVSIVGENLFLLSKRKGLNPMADYSGVSSSIDYDYAKIISANISVSF